MGTVADMMRDRDLGVGAGRSQLTPAEVLAGGRPAPAGAPAISNPLARPDPMARPSPAGPVSAGQPPSEADDSDFGLDIAKVLLAMTIVGMPAAAAIEQYQQRGREREARAAAAVAQSRGLSILADNMLKAGPGGGKLALAQTFRAISAEPTLIADEPMLPEIMRKTAEEMMQPAPEAFAASPGQAFGSRDPVTGQVQIQGQVPFKPDAAPNSVREAQAMNMDLATAEGRAAYGQWKRMQTRPAAGVTVNLPTAARENPWTSVGMDRVTAADEKMAQALQLIPDLRAMRTAIEGGAYQALDAPEVGLKTPWGTIGIDLQPQMVSFLRLGTALGLVDPADMSATEAFEAIQARLIPMLRPAGSGSASDADMKLFADALPNLTRTREGNLAIVELFEKAAERNRQELALLEKMIEAGTYTPSEYAQRVLAMGNVWTPAERRLLDDALKPEAPAAAGPVRGPGDPSSVSGR